MRHKMENVMNLMYKPGSAGMAKLTPEKRIEVFKANLAALAPFSKGEVVKIAEVKYGRQTEVKLGMPQKLPVGSSMEEAKLVGLALAASSADDEKIATYKGPETGNTEIPIRNFTGYWKPAKGEKFSDGKYERQYSIFTGKF